MTDEELIAEAVAEGRVRKIPLGMTSGWDDLSFKEKRAVMFERFGYISRKEHQLLVRNEHSSDFRPIPLKLGIKR